MSMSTTGRTTTIQRQSSRQTERPLCSGKDHLCCIQIFIDHRKNAHRETEPKHLLGNGVMLQLLRCLHCRNLQENHTHLKQKQNKHMSVEPIPVRDQCSLCPNCKRIQ